MIQITQKYKVRSIAGLVNGDAKSFEEKEITLNFKPLRFDVYEDKKTFMQYLEYSKNMDVPQGKVSELIKMALDKEFKHSEDELNNLLNDHQACFILLAKISKEIITPYMGELAEL